MWGSDPGKSLEIHSELFRHYSSMLFRARVLILSVILLVFGLVFGVGKLVMSEGSEILRVTAEAALASLAAFIIALLYSMETAYIRRLAEVAASARYGLGGSVRFRFFDDYRALWHWPLIVLYVLAMGILCLAFLVDVAGSSQSVGKLIVAAILSLSPFILFGYTTKRHSVELRRLAREAPDRESR